MAEPDAEVKTLLDAITSPVALTAASANVGPYSGNLALGPMPPSEDGAAHTFVSVELQTGGLNLPFLGAGAQEYQDHVLVTIRGEPHDYDGALSLARACLSACKWPTVSGYALIEVLEPHPVFTGIDDHDRYLFRFTVKAWRVV